MYSKFGNNITRYHVSSSQQKQNQLIMIIFLLPRSTPRVVTENKNKNNTQKLAVYKNTIEYLYCRLTARIHNRQKYVFVIELPCTPSVKGKSPTLFMRSFIRALYVFIDCVFSHLFLFILVYFLSFSALLDPFELALPQRKRKSRRSGPKGKGNNLSYI